MVPSENYELAIPAADWQRAVMPLFSDRSRWVTAALQFEPGLEQSRFLLERFAAARLQGSDHPPLSTWLAVAAPEGEPPDTPKEWVRRLRPLFGQTLVILLIGFGADRSGWRGWVVEHQTTPLNSMRIVGPGMVHVKQSVVDDIDEENPERWSRLQGAVGERAYRKLRQAHVALVGCSRTGTLAGVMLSSLGVRFLDLIDGDEVESVNLDGMFTVSPGSVGSNKSLALAKSLVYHRPDMTVRAIARDLDSDFPEPSKNPLDLVVTCCDQNAPRLRVAHWCREHLTPHLDIGSGVTMTDEGQEIAADVRLFLPRSGCVRCVGGLTDIREAEYELFAPPGALPHRSAPEWNSGGRLGSLITVNALAVSAGVQSWLDLLDGSLTGSIWHRLCWVPGSGIESRSALVRGRSGCKVCGAS